MNIAIVEMNYPKFMALRGGSHLFQNLSTPSPINTIDIKFGQYNSDSFREKLKMFNGERKHIAKVLLTNSGD